MKINTNLSDVQRDVPSTGSQAFGSMFFQYLLCSIATCQMVSVATSEATMGPNCGGTSPKMTRATASADTEIASRL